MPKNSSSDRNDRKSRTPFNGYVKCVLQDTDNEAIDDLLQGDLEAMFLQTMKRLVAWASLGYKVSLEFRDTWEEFQWSMYCRHEDDPNYGWILTASGEDAFEALITLVYKHESVYREGEWTNYGAARRKRR